MKQTLTTHDIADALKRDENAGWSWEGAKALAEYLEQYEEDTGSEFELNVVDIRCDYSEYSDLQDWAGSHYGTIAGECQAAKSFGWDEDTTDDEKDEAIREYINAHGQLIEFNGGIIVSSF